MTEPPPTLPVPHRVLHRAVNVATVPGALVNSDPNLPLSRQNSGSNIGASFRKTFKAVKDSPLSLSVLRHSRDGSGHGESVKGKRISAPAPKKTQQPEPGSLPRASTAQELNSDPAGDSDTPPTDFTVPDAMREGTRMTKVSAKKQSNATFRINPDQDQILWEGKKPRIIPIRTIKELRSGSDARYYRAQFQLSADYEDRWLTIVYILDGNYKTLHLVAPSKEDFIMWDVTLRRLHNIRQSLMSGLGNVEMRQNIWEKQYWSSKGADHEQRLGFEDVEKLCKRLHINSSTEDLLRLFRQADQESQGFLNFNDFRQFVKLLKNRPELDQLYKKLSSTNNGRFEFHVFEKFMQETQKSELTQSQLLQIFQKYCPDSTTFEDPVLSSPTPLPSVTIDVNAPGSPSSPPGMSLDAFTSFLMSVDNAVFLEQAGKVTQDMGRPLSEYFISSSHNTYLVGHQLVGVSTIEGYIRALLHGCRSVEVDVYDGEVEPMIFHGKTFTSKVSVREVCEAIKKYAFVASPYPIIISAEIHCSVYQQDVLADILIGVFGDSLIRAPTGGRPIIPHLPSPDDLKGCILLKAKNVHICESESTSEVFLEDTSVSETTTSTSSDAEGFTILRPPEWKHETHGVGGALNKQKDLKGARAVMDRVRRHSSPRKLRLSRSSFEGKSAHAEYVTDHPQQLLRPLSRTDRTSTKKKMSEKLLNLLVYTIGVKCRGLNKKEHYALEHMFSLSEKAANKFLKHGSQDLIKHCRTHLVRVYPNGTRLSSTNYEPHRFWGTGSQLVAINWQTFDLGYMINHAMFQRNGRSGFVLKPPALRLNDKDLLNKRTQHCLDVKVISAQQLPRPKDSYGREIVDNQIIDPFVEVSVHTPDWSLSSRLPQTPSILGVAYSGPTSLGSPAKVTSPRTVTCRTSVVRDNGFNPVWQESFRLPFDCVGDMMDLIFVKFVVRQEDEESGEPLAVYCASLGSLQQGYRHLPLHDSQMSQYLFSTLFVQISVYEA